MLRVIKDPLVEEPNVISFKKEESIEINWKNDPGADEYIIFKAEDAILPVYEILYQGTDLSVIDTNVTGESRYLYTLGKIRGKKLFGPSENVLGIGSKVIEDELEDNNTKETATKLIWNLDANLYYYRSFHGSELVDKDWYNVIVPPKKQSNIIITYDESSGTELFFYLEGHIVQTVSSGLAIPVTNNSFEEKAFYFQVSPNILTFINDPTTGGGSLKDYNIFIHSITTP